jgi:hypothetical protein
MSALLLIIGLAGQCLPGVALAEWLLGTGGTKGAAERRNRAELWGVGIVLGTAAVSWILFVWSLCGGGLGSGISWALSTAGWLLGGGTWWRRWRSWIPSSAAPTPETVAAVAWARCVRIGIAILLAASFAQTLLTPQRFWDERAIFAIKGKVLFDERTIHSPLLAHPDFVQGHPRYPLLIPLAEAHVYALLGGIDDRWSKAVFPLLFGGLVLAYLGVLSRRFGPARGELAALLVASMPVLFPFELGVISGQGDAPVACIHGLTLLFAWDALWRDGVEGGASGNWRRWLLVGLLAASCAFTKDEGIAFLIVGAISLCGAWLAGALRKSTRPAFPARKLALALLVLGGTAALLLGPWFWHRRGLPTTTEMNYLGRLSVGLLVERLDALHWLVPHLASRMFREWRTWGLQWWLLGAALITAPRRALRPEQLFLLLNLGGAVAALIVAGMIAPADLHDHIGGSSERYLMQLAPGAVLFAAGQWWGDVSDGKRHYVG